MTRDRKPDLAAIRAWQKVFRDILITLLGAFMLISQAVLVDQPNALIVGAALVLLGLPATFRLDDIVKRADNNGNGDENGNGGHEDRWSHLP